MNERIKITCFNHFTGEIMEIESVSKTQAKRYLLKMMRTSIFYDRKYGFAVGTGYKIRFHGNEIHFYNGKTGC